MPVAYVLITSTTLDKMIAEPRFVEAFPFLQNPPRVKSSSGCGTCGRRHGETASSRARTGGTRDYNLLKQLIAELPSAQKRLMLQMLDAMTGRICYRDRSGKLKQMELN